MTTLQAACKALEALERIGKDFVCRSAHHAKKDQHSAFAECPVVVRHTDAIESLRTALAQQVEQAKPAAYITLTEQGPMVWTPEMYDEACTYCDDGEFPMPLYTATPRPTSGDYALGYAEGFNDACKPAPQAQEPCPNGEPCKQGANMNLREHHNN